MSDDSPQRRYEDRHLVAYAIDLFRGEHITKLNRWLALAYSVGCWIWGGSLIFMHNGRAYDNQVFDGIFTLAHPIAWGITVWMLGCIMFLTATTAKGLLFLLAIVGMFGYLLAWSGGVMAQAALTEATLTGGAIALYIFAFTGLAAMAFSPQPLVYLAHIVERTEDGVVLELREYERRAG